MKSLDSSLLSEIPESQLILLVVAIVGFIGLLIVIVIHHFYSKKKDMDLKLKLLRRYYKKREKRRQRTSQLLALAQFTSPKRYCDSLLGTPQKGCYRECDSLCSSTTRSRKASRLWELENSTDHRPPILKKYQSDTPSNKEDSCIRFRKYRIRDTESEVSPQKLQFSDDSYGSILHKRPRRTSSRDSISHRYAYRKESPRKDKDSLLNIFSFGASKDESDHYQDKDYPRRPRVLDLRCIDNKENVRPSNRWRPNYDPSRTQYTRQYEVKNSFGDYDLFGQNSFN
ncbi:unnamed protein product [Moneuplotes crassus]|uniref:Uncharacterized protein n=1 Tax=Euplotes crassus TaxID=5936 RepID=A0AAD1XSB2_EUPCR|nr:unnamed protein product [Moneuplotes crassus]